MVVSQNMHHFSKLHHEPLRVCHPNYVCPDFLVRLRLLPSLLLCLRRCSFGRHRQEFGEHFGWHHSPYQHPPRLLVTLRRFRQRRHCHQHLLRLVGLLHLRRQHLHHLLHPNSFQR